VGRVHEARNRPKKISLVSLARSRAEYTRRKLTKVCYGDHQNGSENGNRKAHCHVISYGTCATQSWKPRPADILIADSIVIRYGG
jgi:hypothetical protein